MVNISWHTWQNSSSWENRREEGGRGFEGRSLGRWKRGRLTRDLNWVAGERELNPSAGWGGGWRNGPLLLCCGLARCPSACLPCLSDPPKVARRSLRSAPRDLSNALIHRTRATKGIDHEARFQIELLAHWPISKVRSRASLAFLARLDLWLSVRRWAFLCVCDLVGNLHSGWRFGVRSWFWSGWGEWIGVLGDRGFSLEVFKSVVDLCLSQDRA